MQAGLKKGLLSLVHGLRSLWSLMSSPKSNVAERSKRHEVFFPIPLYFFFQCLHFFQCFTHVRVTHVHVAGKGFPDALHVGSALHFQMELGQNNVESHGGKNAAWRRLSPCEDREWYPQTLCISGWEADELQWITTFTGRCQLS